MGVLKKKTRMGKEQEAQLVVVQMVEYVGGVGGQRAIIGWTVAMRER